MIHSFPNTDRVAALWAPTGRWLDAICQAAMAALRGGLRVHGIGNGAPELRMSREWLDEYERHARKHPDAL